MLDAVTLDQLRTFIAAAEQGSFSAAGRNIFDPLSRTFNDAGVALSATQFPANQIPKSRFDQASLKLLEFFPNPTQPGNSLVRNFARNASQPIDSDSDRGSCISIRACTRSRPPPRRAT